jgi:hypothetical protein
MKLQHHILNLKTRLELWLAQLLYRWRVRQLLERVHDAPRLQPTRALVQETLQALQPERFDHYRPHAGQSQQVLALLPNIESYTAKLAEAWYFVEDQKVVPSDWLSTETEHHLSVDSFLITPDGYYANQQRAVAAFRTQALRLCEALQPADQEDAGIYEHNLRVLTRLFVNLRLLAAALLVVSLTK